MAAEEGPVFTGDDGEEVPEEGLHAEHEEVASSRGEPNGGDLNAVLRLIAETQKMMLTSQSTGGVQKARILATVKIPDIDGSQTTTVRRYREWRKAVDIIRQLNGLSPKELAMLIYSQVSGRAKQLVEVIEAKDFEQDAVLDVIWGIYDNAFEKMAHER